MAHDICPGCHHERGEHDETGRCGQPLCSCIVDPRSPPRLDSGPLKPPFSDLPQKESISSAVARAAATNPFSAFVFASFILAGCAILLQWLTNRYSTEPWVRAHEHALGLIKTSFLLISMPGIIIDKFYIPKKDRGKVTEFTMTICVVIAGVGIVLIGVLSLLDR